MIISSPDGRRRRTSGNSDMSETEERPPPPAASLPVKKRIMEAVQEEEKKAARVPPTEVTPEDKKVSDVGNFEVWATVSLVPHVNQLNGRRQQQHRGRDGRQI